MKIGNFRFGNDYKFDMKNVVRKEHEDISKLNKIEIRYNTRKNLPSYPAIKSLYQWRSVFGFRLGGILRQAVVKIADVKRPFINAHNLLSSAKDGQLHTYRRLYSSRDVMNAIRSTNPGSSQVKMMKYMSFGQIPERWHELASGQDHSIRNTIMQKFQAVSQNKVTEHFFQKQNDFIDRHNESHVSRPTGAFLGNNASPLRQIDVKEKMSEIRNQKSDTSLRWENNKERIVFKVQNQMDRIAKFFGDWKDLGIKEAHTRLVDRAKRDEETYQSKFNHKSTDLPSDQIQPKVKTYSDDHYIGLQGEKVLKENLETNRPRDWDDKDEQLLQKLKDKNTTDKERDDIYFDKKNHIYPHHYETVVEFDMEVRSKLDAKRKALGMRPLFGSSGPITSDNEDI